MTDNERPTPSYALPGAVVAGKYVIERELGSGGFGVVVGAVHQTLGERVAIKFLHPGNSPGMAERFVREAQATAKIRSEHVVRVSDVGTLESGTPYMIMEFLPGQDLEGVLDSAERMIPIAKAVEWVLQACEAIAEAHSLGIVHRDLKLPNLFLTQRADGSDLIKVLDFGISKQLDVGGNNLTQTAAVMGSPLYMSPEQLRSAKHVDIRTDIWALGVILFHLLSGSYPFNETDNLAMLVAGIMTQPPESLSAFRPDLPEGFERIVMRCLEKEVDQRFADVGELALALQPFGPRTMDNSVRRICETLDSRGVRRSRISMMDGSSISTTNGIGSSSSPSFSGISGMSGTGSSSGVVQAGTVRTMAEMHTSIAPEPEKRGGPPWAAIGLIGGAVMLGGFGMMWASRGTTEPGGAAVGIAAQGSGTSGTPALSGSPASTAATATPGAVGASSAALSASAASGSLQAPVMDVSSLPGASPRGGESRGASGSKDTKTSKTGAGSTTSTTTTPGATPASPAVTATVPASRPDDSRKSW